MEELFFMVSPIWWTQSIPKTIGIVIILLWILYGFHILWSRYVLFRETQKTIKERVQQEFFPIDTQDNFWEQKTLRNIKKHIWANLKHHTEAHTAEEIDKYLRAKQLQESIEILEKSEYQWISLTKEEREKLQEQIMKHIFQSQ